MSKQPMTCTDCGLPVRLVHEYPDEHPTVTLSRRRHRAQVDVEPDWDRIGKAWSLVFSFVPDRGELDDIKSQYARLAAER